ncbi:MAG: hypothetical protein FJX23_06495 [Alphaproteobacteria bacterium]|nr:hypothetical protein [Alphaproteobacteria bacterium]
MAQKYGFIENEQVTVDGEDWLIGKTLLENNDSSRKPISFATAGRQGQSIMLSPTLIDEQGKVEDYELRALNAAGKSALMAREDLPAEILEKLVQTANAEQLHGTAGFHTYPQNSEFGQRVSHSIKIDGKPHKILNFVAKDVEGGLAAVRDHEDNLFVLNVTKVGYDSKVEESHFRTFKNGGWRDADASELSPRAQEEAIRYANKFQLFGLQMDAFKEQVDNRVKDILSETDLDAGLEKILKEHHEKALDDALDTRDFPKAKEEAEATKSHREAEEKLKKPKTHLERLKFEREQQQKVVENGDIERFSR